ncbi:hypothetical protein ACWEGE_05960 [Amycolatopsis sp. NPDC004747]
MTSTKLSKDYATERAESFERLERLCQLQTLSTLGSALVSTGIIVIPAFASPAKIVECLKLIPPHSEMRISREGWSARFVDDANQVEQFGFFFGSSLIEHLISECFDGTANLFRAQVQSREISEIHGPDERPHVDSWRERVKVFLYLTDVTEKNASLVYYPKSHRGTTWNRTRVDESIEVSVSSGSYAADGYAATASAAGDGVVSESTLASLSEHGVNALNVFCPAGTLVAFDARGIHHVTSTEGARRIALMSYWIRNGRHQ